MATGTVVEQLVVELDGRTQKLEAAMKAAEAKLDASAKRMAASTTATGAAATASSGAVDRMATRYSRGAQVMASAAETAARAGKLTGESAKQMIAQGSMMATMFGPTGAIVGAVGIGTLAIVHMFNRAAEESRKARERIEGDFQKLASLESVTGAAKSAQQIWQGTVARPLTPAGQAIFEAQRARMYREDTAQEFGAAFGLQSVREQIAKLQQVKAAYERYGTTTDEVVEKLNAYLKVEKELTAEHKEALAQVTDLGKGEAERAAAAARAAARKKAEEDAKDAAKKLADLEKDAARVRAELALTTSSTLTQVVVAAEREFNPLIIALRDAGKEAEAIALERLRDDATASAIALHQVNTELDEIARSSETAEEEYDRIGILIRETSEELANTTDNETKRAQLTAKLQELYQKQDEAFKRIKVAAEKIKDKTEDVVKTARDLARAIMEAVNGALQLAEAFGLVGEEASKALRGIAQVATGIDPFLKALASGSTGDIIGAGLNLAGGVASLLDGIFGGGRVDRAREELQLEFDAWNESFDQFVRDFEHRHDPMQQELDRLQDWYDEQLAILDDILARRLGIESSVGRATGPRYGGMGAFGARRRLPERVSDEAAQAQAEYDAAKAALDELLAQQQAAAGEEQAPRQRDAATSYTSSGFSAATSTQFDRATDFLRQIAGYTKPISSIEMMLRGILVPAAPLNLSAGVYSMPTPGSAAPVSVTNHVTIHVNGAADPQRTAVQIKSILDEQTIREIDIALAARARRHRQARGDISI